MHYLRNRIGKQNIARVLLLLFLFALVPVSVTRADDREDLEETIRNSQNAISEAEKQKKALQSGLTDVKKMVSELEGAKKDLKQYVVKLDSNLDQIEQKIEELKQTIAQKEEEIEETGKALKEATEVADSQYASMKTRVKFMYEQGQTFYLDLLFGAKNFGELLNRTEFIEKIAAYDRKKLEEYRETRDKVAAFKEELEAEKLVLDAAKEGVEEEEAALNTLISEKQREITNYQSDINNKEAIIKEYENEIAEQNQIISALEAAVKEAKKKLSGTAIKYDGGKFKWPAPEYTRISDDYGSRIHPILKTQQFHNGVDMAAPSGSPILAAYDGEVVAADYSGSMGNYIMIDHGDDLYTIYMHASKLYVSKGQQVSRGDKIAAVGSTGRSTGPHLHFSVRQSGSYVSPWNYLSK
ncbi:MAG: peptidase M23 [Lachnospiraceae bacterium]|nr:peptidase M23 [Lachnospiraceae bacterium]